MSDENVDHPPDWLTRIEYPAHCLASCTLLLLTTTMMTGKSGRPSPRRGNNSRESAIIVVAFWWQANPWCVVTYWTRRTTRMTVVRHRKARVRTIRSPPPPSPPVLANKQSSLSLWPSKSTTNRSATPDSISGIRQDVIGLLVGRSLCLYDDPPGRCKV